MSSLNEEVSLINNDESQRSPIESAMVPSTSNSALPNNETDQVNNDSVDVRPLVQSDSYHSLEWGAVSQPAAPRFFFQRRAISSHSSFASNLCTAPTDCLLDSTQGEAIGSGEYRSRMDGPRRQFVSRSRQLAKGTLGALRVKGKSAISLRPPEISNGLSSPCVECPYCRKRGNSREVIDQSFGHACSCRICAIISDGDKGASTLLKSYRTTKMALTKVPLTLGGIPRVSSEVGLFCEHCNESGFILPDGRCSRFVVQSQSMQQTAVSIDERVGTFVETEACIGGERKSSREIGGPSSSYSNPNPFAVILSSSRSQQSLSSVLTANEQPLCRICHSTSDASTDSLMSPCRCSGSLKFVHLSCLVHWLDISSRKLRRPPICELCHYRYRRHKALKWNTMKWPSCRRSDKFFHLLFVLAVMIMLACAVATIVCFQFEKKYGRYAKEKSVTNINATHPLQPELEVNDDREVNRIVEVVTLVAGVMFFVGFFVAMYAEVKAHVTIYKYLRRYWAMNHEWVIDEYRPAKDMEYVRELDELRRRNRPKRIEDGAIMSSPTSSICVADEEITDLTLALLDSGRKMPNIAEYSSL